MEKDSLPLLPSFTPSIDDFFKDTNIFITGGTGFLGKVLIEKLLRSCTGIKNIFLLIRVKRNTKPLDRLQAICNSTIFEKLKEDNAEALKKLHVISGDLELLKSGISTEDEEYLKRNIHIIFHVGASVRFDDPIKKAVLLNTRGTREIINLAQQMEHLKVFVHVSTAYANLDKPIIDEKVHRNETNYATMIRMVEEMNPEILNCLQPKILNGLPNTYIFTKSLAEDIINDNQHLFPCVIFRPSTVFNIYEEPIEGWIDNLQGASGLLVGGGMGIIHTAYGDKDSQLEWIPADFTIRGMIIAAWYAANREDKTSCLVINAGLSSHITRSAEKILKSGVETGKHYPLEKMIWYPFGHLTSNKFIYNLEVVLFHIIPALFFDTVLKCKGETLRLMKIYRKIYFVNGYLKPFMRSQNQWKFITDNFLSLDKLIKPEDKLKYCVNVQNFDYNEMWIRSALAVNRYFFNNRNYDPNKAKRKFYRLYLLHNTVIFLFASAIFYTVWTLWTHSMS